MPSSSQEEDEVYDGSQFGRYINPLYPLYTLYTLILYPLFPFIHPLRRPLYTPIPVSDEKDKEDKRMALEEDCAANRPKKLYELVKQHNKEREFARYYITQLQTDNEIIFLTKVNECGFVW